MVQEGEMALNLPATELPDTLQASDSVVYEPVYGLLLTAPQPREPAPLRPEGQNGVSFIVMGMFILFLVIALRFRNNIKYAVKMFRDLMEIRTRQNFIDETVRETSLLVMLNILWCACAGIIGFCVYNYLNPAEGGWNYNAKGMLVGMGIASVYFLFMLGMYGSVAWVFADSSHASLWVRGFTASQALMAPALFITALIGIYSPWTAPGVGIMSAIVFVLAKLVFIWKGYMIFFQQISSWVLFLCYLCSLEIVPLVMSYRCALLLGDML